MRAAYCLGPVEGKELDPPPPAGRRWIPPRFDDVTGARRPVFAADLHEYIESAAPRTSSACRSRRFCPGPTKPYWGDCRCHDAMANVAMGGAKPLEGIDPLRKISARDPKLLSEDSDMKLGRPFPELTILSDTDRILAARYLPYFQLWGARRGRSEYAAPAVNLEKKADEFPTDPRRAPTISQFFLTRRLTRDGRAKKVRRRSDRATMPHSAADRGTESITREISGRKW